jgi:hypothetical protein
MGSLFDNIRKNNTTYYSEKNKSYKVTNEPKSDVSNQDCSANSCNFLVTSPISEDREIQISPRKCWICSVTCRGYKLKHGDNYEYQPHYAKLLESGIDDLNTDICLPAAFFLHAIGMVRSSDDAGFEAMCRRMVPHWRQRLEKAGLDLVGVEIKGRLAQINAGKGNGNGDR